MHICKPEMKLRKTAYLLLFTLISISAMGQLAGDQTNSSVADTTGSEILPRIQPRMAYESDIEVGIDSFHFLDSSLRNFHRYGLEYKNFAGVENLGMVGSAFRPLVFDRRSGIGFDYGVHTYDHILKDASNTSFYESKVPFTKFFYTQGKEGFLYLRAFHTQNIKPNWNVAINFSSLKNDGLYERQNQKEKSSQVSSKYTTGDGKFQVLSGMNWNRIVLSESGGVQSDSLFEAASSLNKRVPVNLTSASTTIKTREHFSHHFLRLGPTKTKIRQADTANYVVPKSVIYHKINWKRSAYHYIDPNPTGIYYPNIPFDNNSLTSDSITSNSLENRIGINIPISIGDGTFNWKGELAYSYFNVKQGDSTKLESNNLAIRTRAELARKSKFMSNSFVDLSYVTTGYNEGDVQIIAESELLKLSNFRILGELWYSSKRPSYMTERFYSNHLAWRNDFQKEELLSGFIGFESKVGGQIFGVRGGCQAIDNFVYYDSFAEARQDLSETINVMGVGFYSRLTFGSLHFDNAIYWQDASDYKNIQMPEFVSEHQLYFQENIFSSSLKIQFGVEAFYSSEYMGNLYNPVSRQFHLQNENRIGDYPMVNLFLNGEIKTLRFFFEYEHLNQDWGSSRYYGSVHQPISPRRFLLGLGWKMYY
jgi:hypothetical protein